MLLICPVRPGDQNEELRYALRSWETNLHPPTGLTLMVVGDRPSWLNPDWYVEGNRHTSTALAVFDNIVLGTQAAMEASYEDEPALYMNDDFFCMDPTDSVLPVKRNCTLAEHIAMFGQSRTWWSDSLRLTASFLSEEGFPHPDSYEVHRPLPAAPGAMFEALTQWNGGSQHWTTDSVPQWRTVYGTLHKVDAYPVIDGKLGLKNLGVGTPWLSTSDQSWRRYASIMKTRFQKPSRWERVTQ